MKKLYRSRKNMVVSGVLGGVGEYFEIDPVVVRVVFVVLLALTGGLPFILVYAFMLILVPLEPDVVVMKEGSTKE